MPALRRPLRAVREAGGDTPTAFVLRHQARSPLSDRARLREHPAGALIGPATAALCEPILEHKPHPEQGFRSCLGILRLARALVPHVWKPPLPVPSRSARSPTDRSAPSSTTSLIDALHRVPGTARRSSIPTSAARATANRRPTLLTHPALDLLHQLGLNGWPRALARSKHLLKPRR
jgi:hypothetical protein